MSGKCKLYLIAALEVVLLWKQLSHMVFKNNQIAACFCMLGACKSQGQNKQHLQWLQTIADRAACGLIALDGSSMFSEENAAAVKKCFPDVLMALQRQRKKRTLISWSQKAPMSEPMQVDWAKQILVQSSLSRVHGPWFIHQPACSERWQSDHLISSWLLATLSAAKANFDPSAPTRRCR